MPVFPGSTVAEPRKPTILVDNREQQPWTFSKNEWEFGWERATLKTGDYTLAGLEDKVVIEKKKTPAELAQNLLQPRFERELKRLEAFPHPFIVCDFPLYSLEQYPNIPSVPRYLRKKIRAKGPYLLKLLGGLQTAYKAEWFFVMPGMGREKLLEIFRTMLEKYHK